MLALVLREGADFDTAKFASWLDRQADLGPKWQPRFLRLCEALPSTPTNKILTRTLVHEKFRSDRVHGDPVFRRARGDASFHAFTARRRGRPPHRIRVERAILPAWDL